MWRLPAFAVAARPVGEAWGEEGDGGRGSGHRVRAADDGVGPAASSRCAGWRRVAGVPCRRRRRRQEGARSAVPATAWSTSPPPLLYSSSSTISACSPPGPPCGVLAASAPSSGPVRAVRPHTSAAPRPGQRWAGFFPVIGFVPGEAYAIPKSPRSLPAEPKTSVSLPDRPVGVQEQGIGAVWERQL